VSLAQVRERQFVARKKLSAGIDPMAERNAEAESRQRTAEAKQREAESSFENIARKWWEWWSVGKSPRHRRKSCDATGSSPRSTGTRRIEWSLRRERTGNPRRENQE